MSPQLSDLRAIAHRAAARALAGSGEFPVGAHSDLAARPARIAEPSEAPTDLIDLEALAPLLVEARAEGVLRLPPGVRLSDAAREEVWGQGLRCVETGPDRGPLRVAVGSDHGGFERKADVLEWLAELGYVVQDHGTRDKASCDYPDFARSVAEAVASGQADLGVVLDGAGLGSAMTANKVPGVLAAPAWNAASAANAREHNHANVLTLGAGLLSREELHVCLRAFLAARPGPGRHARRVAKIHAVQRDHSRA